MARYVRGVSFVRNVDGTLACDRMADRRTTATLPEVQVRCRRLWTCQASQGLGTGGKRAMEDDLRLVNLSQQDRGRSQSSVETARRGKTSRRDLHVRRAFQKRRLLAAAVEVRYTSHHPPFFGHLTFLRRFSSRFLESNHSWPH